MPTYSCHISDELAKTVDEAIKDSPEGKEGPWLKEAAMQRLQKDGYVENTEKFDIRKAALEAADLVGPEAVLGILKKTTKEALALKADVVP